MTEYRFDFKDIVEAVQDVVIVTRGDPLNLLDSKIVYVNKAFTESYAYNFDEVIGKSTRTLLSEDDHNAHTLLEIRHALENREARTTRIKSSTQTGQESWLNLSIVQRTHRKGKVSSHAAQEGGISDKQSHEIIHHKHSIHDELTGLLNRAAFEKMIAQEFLRYLRTHNKFSVLLINIDDFKGINEKYGQSAGDQALINLADHFKLLFRGYDQAVRVGGDEFCIVLLGSSQIKAQIGAERLRHMVEKNHLSFNDEEISMTISIGVAEAEETDLDFHGVLERAEIALSNARKKGRNRVQKFIR